MNAAAVAQKSPVEVLRAGLEQVIAIDEAARGKCLTAYGCGCIQCVGDEALMISDEEQE